MPREVKREGNLGCFLGIQTISNPGTCSTGWKSGKTKLYDFFSTPWYSHMEALPDARGDIMCRDRARRQQEMLLLQEQ